MNISYFMLASWQLQRKKPAVGAQMIKRKKLNSTSTKKLQRKTARGDERSKGTKKQ